MSEENDVVIEESNPTNEDFSIDTAIGALYDEPEAEEEKPAVEDTEVVEESKDEVTEEVADDGETLDDDEFSLPNNMPKELQDALSGFDEDSKKQHTEVFKKMQGSFTKKNQDFAAEKKFAENINKAFDGNGLNVRNVEQKQALVSNYIAFDKLLENNPKAAVKQMMDYAGLKPDDFGAKPTPTDSSEDEFLTDSEQRTKTQIDELTELVRTLTQQSTRSREATQSQEAQIVTDFRDAKNEQGELVNPHWDIVKDEMMDLSDMNPNLTIQQLYSKAVRMNDDLFEQTIEREKKSALEAVDVKRKAGVEKAKKLNRQSRPTSSVDSTIVDEDAIFEQLVASAGW